MSKFIIGNRCKRCLIRDVVPETTVDRNNVCNHCHDVDNGVRPNSIHFTITEEQKKKYQDALHHELSTTRGSGDYDAILGFSGGKDSIYLLHKLKEDYPHLRILAATVNTSFLNRTSMKNFEETLKNLDVDHIYLTPRWKFIKKFYKYLLEHRIPGGYKAGVDLPVRGDTSNTGLCAYCHELVSDIMMVYAMNNDIPLHLSGIAPGQPFFEYYHRPPEEIAARDNTPPFMYHAPFTEEDRIYTWNPKKYPSDAQFPRMLYPLHVWKYNADEMRQEIFKAGLIQKIEQTNPVRSNCTLNYVMTNIDMQIDGYFNMLPYWSFLIRHGLMEKKSIEKLVKRLARIMKIFGRVIPPEGVKIEKVLEIDSNEIIKKFEHQRLRKRI